MSTPAKLYQTNVSQAFWCTLADGEAKFQPAKIRLAEHEEEGPIAWFDKLFKGGLLLPETDDKPLTMLIAGPPGSGKTTLALEICYRLAKNDGERNDESLFTLYISTDQEAERIVKNARDLGFQDVDKHVVDFADASKRPEKYDVNRVAVWGKDEIRRVWEATGHELKDIVQAAINTLSMVLIGTKLPERISRRMARLFKPGRGDDSQTYQQVQPDILVIDSLNIVSASEREDFFKQFMSATSSGSKMVIFVLDSASASGTHEIWEYACDVVVRLDYNDQKDYYLRTIEVIKARYQSHIWGKHQVKIYEKPNLPEAEIEGRDELMLRSHPYRREGGIVIYPSIHYYLSLYKRRGLTTTTSFAKTKPALNGMLDEGIPEGRCTAFLGARGGHKSHLGYLHILNRLINYEEENETALVVSLRDDERMTWETMERIRNTEFEGTGVTLRSLQERNRLEFLYYHPGNITPEEFFHRMFISIHRLKQGGKKLTVLFNSLDQLRSRFPLCAKQEIFVPGIIEFLSGEGATSIFIAVDEPGQPAEQYGLLPMADLILSFYPRRFKFNDYYNHLNESRNLDAAEGDLKKRIEKLKEAPSQYIEEVVLQVVRFAGGQRAGAQGLLELVSNKNLGLYKEAGLYFTRLSPKYNQGIPVFRRFGGSIPYVDYDTLLESARETNII